MFDLFFSDTALPVTGVDGGYKGLLRRGQKMIRHTGLNSAVVHFCKYLHAGFLCLGKSSQHMDSCTFAHGIAVGTVIEKAGFRRREKPQTFKR